MISACKLCVCALACSVALAAPFSMNILTSPLFFPDNVVAVVANGWNQGFGDFWGGNSVLPLIRRAVVSTVKGSTVQSSEKEARCLAMAIGGLETSYGRNMPQYDEQARRGKWGNDKQENGYLRINTGMLKYLGLPQVSLNTNTEEEHKKVTASFMFAINKLGVKGFMSFHRGGITQYEEYKRNGRLHHDVEKYWQLVGMLQKACVNRVDLSKDNQHLPWLDGNAFGLHEI
jgi:hypothetical protein